MSLFGQHFDANDPKQNTLTPEENDVLERLARKVVDKGFTVPSILFLESVKPMNFIGSQALVFFEPIIQTLFNFRDYESFRTGLEKRESIEVLLQKIEAYDAVAHEREKRIKAFYKKEKKNWKWYQRWLGVAIPKVQIPDDILEGSEKKDNPEQDSR